jgi:ATP-dependent DNA helicase RecG
MEDPELLDLLHDGESDRVERKASHADTGKIRQAVCAFANDLPGHGKPGVVFVGVNDDGTPSGILLQDELLRQLADMALDGSIVPRPTAEVRKLALGDSAVAALVTYPSDSPPVRCRGTVRVRVGPSTRAATAEEERRLVEKRLARDLPFDLQPVRSASLEDLDLDLFRRTYLPSAVAPGALEANDRTSEQQLASVRFTAALDMPCPTVLGLVAVGKSPADFVPGAYVQFLRLEGTELADPIADQKEIHGPLPELMRRLDDIIAANIHVATDIRSAPTEIRRPDYPIDALQQLVRNAVMHRDYAHSNAPVRVSWFADRVEIQNPGGPYGQVTRENFGTPGVADYRNPNLAAAMKDLGFVQRFGMGIQIARRSLALNGNPGVEFDVQSQYILATVRRRR